MDTNTRLSDGEIVQLIRKKDPEGLTVLYETFRAEFVHWAVKFTKCDKNDAFDYYQATVIIVYDNIHTGKIEDLKSSLKTYVFSVGKNLAWQHKRQTARNEKISAEYYLELHMNTDDEHTRVEQENNLDLVSDCFNQLGDPCHSLLDLFYYHKNSMEEIALKLNYKNPETAKNQKYKCMERLRKLVEAQQEKQPVEK
jgi:RNA polymerase sigma factor (sigma-70 family)